MVNGTALLALPAGPLAPLPPAVGGVGEVVGGGCVWTPARPRFPAVLPHGTRGTWGPLTQRTLSLAFVGFVCGERSSPPRGGPSRRRAAHRLGVLSALSPGPLWCPWSAPGCLRCPRPSGGVVSRSQRPRPAAAVGGVSGERWVEPVREAHPPPLWGCGRLVVPCRVSCQRGGLDLAGRVSDRTGPSQRCGAWPA